MIEVVKMRRGAVGRGNCFLRLFRAAGERLPIEDDTIAFLVAVWSLVTGEGLRGLANRKAASLLSRRRRHGGELKKLN
ncbi:hypothetical protein Rcae01_05939 [Novipirellula caenicola]|uniref:Uncharacterized protein n=1 Tax=Novipirellula caenicola TaxID=1536901 RepID=A0ABP9W013_9BACT